ncbi:hypothetical protein JCM5353_005241 [Sporobolomyces roseus]
MKLKPPSSNNTATGVDGWESLQSHLNPLGAATPDTQSDPLADSPKLDNDSNLDSLQLADSLLDNVIKCTDCNKPVLQASLEDHQATCPNSQNPQSLKRRLSQDSNPTQPKKSKITLHFNNSNSPTPPVAAAADTPNPSASNANSTSSLPNSTKPSPSPLPNINPTLPQASIASTSSTVPPLPENAKKNKRVVDPDRQCCVINERGLPCQRSLTCKTHNMSSKRAVPHRSVSFDILLLEWQKASRLGKERELLSKGLRGDPLGSIGVGSEDSQNGKKDGGNGKKKRASLVDGLQPNSPLGGGGGTSNLLVGNSNGSTLLNPSSTLLKKSKKPSTSSNLPLFTRVGEAPTPTGSEDEYGGGGEESEDYLSSSDEVESVLLSLRRLPKGVPLAGVREGGGSGWGASGWWTGRNRKLGRLRGVMGGGMGENGAGGIFGGANGQGKR